jgi:large subunit ribosomal protein L21
MSAQKNNPAASAKIAVIETGSKQYKVSVGDKIKVEKLEGKTGDKIEFKNILLLKGEKEIKIGAPAVKGAKAVAEIIAQKKAPKVIIFKYKAKERQRVFKGHRQPFTEMKIVDIIEK